MALREEKLASVQRIDFDEGDWVDIRTNMTAGDHQRAIDAMVTTYTDEGGQLQQRTSTGAFKMALLTQMIVGWSDPEQVNEETIADLPNWIAEELVEAIDKFGRKRRTKEERDPLSKSSTSSSEPPEDSGKSTEELDGPAS